MSWAIRSFTEVFSDVSAGSPKVLQSDFVDTGRYPIVDQGVRPVAGYTDAVEVLSPATLPIVVFGDHTRRFKYVDQQFAVGADGVKLLRPSPELDTKFAFHYLSSLTLPNAGYSRHFKFLKEVRVPVPPLPEQRRIAAILDQTDELRGMRCHALALLDSLVSGLVASITSRTDWPVVRIHTVAQTQGGLTVNRKRAALPRSSSYLRVANVFRGSIDLANVKQIGVTEADLQRVALEHGDLLIVEGHGNENEVGRAARWSGDGTMVHQNHLIRVRPNDDVLDSIYAEAFINSVHGRAYFRAVSKTTSGLNTINMTNVKEMPVNLPPIDVQRIFATQIASIKVLQDVHRAHLAKLDELFASLQHRAFRGEL
ncbi:MAG: restriction endonuclease subunit S [Homoserinimonas sp.]